MLEVGAARHWLNGPARSEPLRWRRVPLLTAALCFAGGIVAARHWHGPMMLATAASCLLLLTLLALWKAPRVAVIAALGLWFALGCWCAQLQSPIATQAQLTQYADGLSRTVVGRVVRVRDLPRQIDDGDAPQPSYDAGAWDVDAAPTMQSVDLDVLEVEEVTPDVSTLRPVQGGVRVAVTGGELSARCGDVLQVALRLRLPEVYRDPGAWSYRDQLLSEGIGATASARADRVVRAASSTASWRCRLHAAQAWASRQLQRYVASPTQQRMPRWCRITADDAAMLDATLLGDRAGLRHSVRVGFERTGTFHLFVVSGVHLVLLAGVVVWLLRKLRLPDAVTVPVTIAVATMYALLTGFGVPVQRALAMSAAYLVARWLGRQITALNALGAAVLLVLVLDPRALYETSFQMTFLAILAIAGLGVPLVERRLLPWSRALHEVDTVQLDTTFEPRLAQLRVRLRMAGELSAVLLHPRLHGLPAWTLRVAAGLAELATYSLAAELCMMLPMAIDFHRATLLALPLNVLVLPLIGVLMACAGITFLTALVRPWLAVLPGAVTALLLHGMRWAIDRAQRFELADLRVPAPPPVRVAAALLLIALACWALRRRGRAWFASGLVGTMLLPLAVLWPAKPLVRAGVLEVTALDVGQGDSLLVVSPEGHAMLVDAGGPVGRAPAVDGWDVGEEVVAPYVWSRRLRRVDVAVLTHAHSDHMGGMTAVLRDLRPRELWLSVAPGRSPGLRALLAEAKELGVAVRWLRAGDDVSWSGVDVQVLAPEASYVNPREAVNNDSLVLRLRYGKASALLEGDAEAPSEAAMLANQRVTASTLLKVGHHGSRTSTTQAFLAAVAPQDAVISVGAHNTFGHPRGEVLERLEEAHARTFRTDRMGAESFWLSADGHITEASATPQ